MSICHRACALCLRASCTIIGGLRGHEGRARAANVGASRALHRYAHFSYNYQDVLGNNPTWNCTMAHVSYQYDNFTGAPSSCPAWLEASRRACPMRTASSHYSTRFVPTCRQQHRVLAVAEPPVLCHPCRVQQVGPCMHCSRCHLATRTPPRLARLDNVLLLALLPGTAGTRTPAPRPGPTSARCRTSSSSARPPLPPRPRPRPQPCSACPPRTTAHSAHPTATPATSTSPGELTGSSAGLVKVRVGGRQRQHHSDSLPLPTAGRCLTTRRLSHARRCGAPTWSATTTQQSR